MHVVVWCRNRMNYNIGQTSKLQDYVVVWCRNRMNYNGLTLWFTTCIVVVWCRNRMNYNLCPHCGIAKIVVVWCRNRMNYNDQSTLPSDHSFWFDVEIEWITISDSQNTAFLPVVVWCGNWISYSGEDWWGYRQMIVAWCRDVYIL